MRVQRPNHPPYSKMVVPMTSNPETDVTAPLVQPTGLGQGWGVYGHGWALNLLAQAAQSGPRHAYLFLGPAQLGKTTLARSFAQALLCTGEGERPCAGCRACRLMGNGGLQGGHPDFRLIQPVDSSGEVDRADGTLRIVSDGETPGSATLDGVALEGWVLPQASLVGGRTLTVEQ